MQRRATLRRGAPGLASPSFRDSDKIGSPWLRRSLGIQRMPITARSLSFVKKTYTVNTTSATIFLSTRRFSLLPRRICGRVEATDGKIAWTNRGRYWTVVEVPQFRWTVLRHSASFASFAWSMIFSSTTANRDYCVYYRSVYVRESYVSRKGRETEGGRRRKIDERGAAMEYLPAYIRSESSRKITFFLPR